MEEEPPIICLASSQDAALLAKKEQIEKRLGEKISTKARARRSKMPRCYIYLDVLNPEGEKAVRINFNAPQL